MSSESTENRVKKAILSVLGTTALAENSNIGEWDSVVHMNVILAVENEFDIEFDEKELAELHSVALLTAAVDRHLSV